jgi:hypothetical protein
MPELQDGTPGHHLNMGRARPGRQDAVDSYTKSWEAGGHVWKQLASVGKSYSLEVLASYATRAQQTVVQV